ncbi:MAG: hypothetical protein ACE5LU_15520 [Anaerolineae bacterium]
MNLIDPKPHPAYQTVLDAASPPGRQYYRKGEYLLKNHPLIIDD